MSRQNQEEEALFRDYLLGSLNEEKEGQVEERLLVDDDFAERLSVAENNLIDDYVFAALLAGERESFEENFIITDERRKKLRLAQALEVYVDRMPAPVVVPDLSVPWWRNPAELLRSYKTWVMVAVIVAFVIFAPKIIKKLNESDQIDRMGAQRASLESRIAEFNRRPNDQLQTLPSYELALDSSLQREDSSLGRAILSGGVKLLILKLKVSPSHEKYRAVVLTAEDTELFGVADLTREGGVVYLKIPSEVLNTDDYQIQLTGTDGVAEAPVRFYFRVIK